MIREILRKEIEKAVKNLFGKEVDFSISADGVHADYSSNVAMVIGGNPLENAEKIRNELLSFSPPKAGPPLVEKIEIAGQGFLNFWLKDEVFIENIEEILKTKEKYGSNDLLKGKKIMVEYTDPNPFKEFHIGHLMSNTIGESISRLYEARGATVKRACYQGDVGLHVAKAIYGKTIKPQLTWNEAYVLGDIVYENIPTKTWYKPNEKLFSDILHNLDLEKEKEKIEDINKKIFSRIDKEINELYEQGREESLKHFEEIYKMLGTKFDYHFFEGKEGMEGKPIVEEFLKKGVFEESDGAVVFRGEKYGLHTRVFISSQGIPTYETKELGLNKAKFEKEPGLSQSIIITANEQSDYFKVVLKAMEQVFPDIVLKTKHIAHGLLRFKSGKMSSRKGNVITGESLIEKVKELVLKKIEEREFSESEKEKISEMVAIAAIKYSILKQAIGGDIIYDFEKSISFEGDSGPYIQYTYVRTCSILRKAKEDKISELKNIEKIKDIKISDVERLIQKFPEIVEMAAEKYAPNYICSYLIDLCRTFNLYYEKNRIVSDDDTGKYRIALTRAVGIVLKNGLNILGISVPERM